MFEPGPIEIPRFLLISRDNPAYDINPKIKFKPEVIIPFDDLVDCIKEFIKMDKGNNENVITATLKRSFSNQQTSDDVKAYREELAKKRLRPDDDDATVASSSSALSDSAEELDSE